MIFRTESWSKSGKPSTTDNPDYPAEALAVTTVTFDGSGSIVDADIEINALTVPGSGSTSIRASCPLEPSAEMDFFDLQDALTHEFGHFIGLAHTCFNPAVDKVRLEDDAGQKVLDCRAPHRRRP